MNTPRQLYKKKKIEKILTNYYNNYDVAKMIIKRLEVIDEIEKKETLEYYMDRWNNIAGSFFEVKNSNYNKFSHVFSTSIGREYHIKKDHIMTFFNITGISYQVVDIIHELITRSHDLEWLEHDDKLYNELLIKLMKMMKCSQNRKIGKQQL